MLVVVQDQAPQPEKNWQLSWEGRVVPLYAVNNLPVILFVDEFDRLIRFNGLQVDLVEGLVDQPERLVIEREGAADGGSALSYQVGNVWQSHFCQAWRKQSVRKTELGATIWSQECSDGRVPYENKVYVNEDGELVLLEFLLSPGKPLARLEFIGSAS